MSKIPHLWDGHLLIGGPGQIRSEHNRQIIRWHQVDFAVIRDLKL